MISNKFEREKGVCAKEIKFICVYVNEASYRNALGKVVSFLLVAVRMSLQV